MAKGPGKGNTNNPNGKPKGLKSKRILQWEQLGDFITQEGAQKAMRILNEMDDDTFIDQYTKLLSYFKPKLTATNISGELKNPEPIQVIIKTPPNAPDRIK